MAWPSEAGAIAFIQRTGGRRRVLKRSRSRVYAPAGAGKFYSDGRGLYRVANAVEYRFYRKLNTAPVVGTDPPFVSNPTLPFTPVPTFSNGIWYVGVTYYDGYVESDFLFLTRIEIVGGIGTANPPSSPTQFRLEQRPGGVVRAIALYWPVPDGDNAATEWAIWRTFDGSTPNPAGAPDYTQTMNFKQGFDIFQYDLAAQADGVTVKALIRTRRLDSSYVYSENAAILTTTANANGPGMPMDLERYPGRLPEDL